MKIRLVAEENLIAIESEYNEVRELAFELEIKGLKYVNQLQNLYNERTN